MTMVVKQSRGAARPRFLQLGERVGLRRPREADAETLARMNRRSKTYHRPWIDAPFEPEMVAAWVRRTRRRNYEGLLATRRDDDAIVGVFNLSAIVRSPFESACLGAYGYPAFAAQGLMGEGLQLVMRHAFATLRLHRIEANVQPGNRRSIEFVRRGGFSYEGYSRRYLQIGGEWRDHERWAILKEDWEAGEPVPRKET